MSKVFINRDLGDESHLPQRSEKTEDDIIDPITINIAQDHISIVDESGNQKQIDADVINLSDDDDAYNDYKVVYVTQDDIDNGRVVCPYTGSSDIFRVSESIYASFDSEEPFMVIVEG